MCIRKWAGIAAALALVLGMTVVRADCDWQLLGEREVDHRAERDQITVDREEGTFRRVQLRVKNAPVEFEKVTVYFESGPEQVLEMRDEIEAGGHTRDIDLQGNANTRMITRVVFDYRTESSGDRAVVQLWGMS